MTGWHMGISGWEIVFGCIWCKCTVDELADLRRRLLPFGFPPKIPDQDEAVMAAAWQLLRPLKYNLAIRPQRDGRNGPSVLRHIFIVLNIHLPSTIGTCCAF